jgi:DNA-binding CsgD family transcriptional regulator
MHRAIQHDVEALCAVDLDLDQLRGRIGPRLARGLTADAFCFGTMDPSTGLVTSHLVEGIPPELESAAAHNEYLVGDVLKFAALATSRTLAGVLSDATGGDLALSHRYRALLPRIGARHELRAVFVIDGQCWGNMSLFRSGRRPDFSPADVELFRRLSATVGAALRRAAHRPASGAAGGPAEAGVLVLGDDFRLLSINAAGRRWIEELATSPDVSLPIAVLDAAARGRRTTEPAYGRLRSASGRWLSVQASPLTSDRHTALTAVLISPAPAAEVTGILQLAYGLSPRERQILGHVISGCSSRAIAGRMHVTAATVQDHLKSMFAKVGVRSRGELVARMLEGGFEPAIQATGGMVPAEG